MIIMNNVTIIKSPNEDTHTAKGDVSFEEFQKANDMHIKDVSNIMNSLAKMIQDTGELELQLKSWNLRFRFCDLAYYAGIDFQRSRG